VFVLFAERVVLQKHGNPMRLQELAIITDTPLMSDPTLLEKFKAHDRVIHDPKTDLYSYRVRTALFVARFPPHTPLRTITRSRTRYRY
jgi:hypothetical protein